MDRRKTGKTVSGDQSYYRGPQSGPNRPFEKYINLQGFDADTWLDGVITNTDKKRAIDRTTKGGTPGREKMTRPRHQPQRLGDYDEYNIKKQASERTPYQYYRFTQINTTQDELIREGEDNDRWETLERIRHLVSGGDGLPAWHDDMFDEAHNYVDDKNMPAGGKESKDEAGLWLARSSRTGALGINIEAAHTAVPCKQVVNMII